MNVFVLCTGRTGSVTFVKACQHIDNYSTAHESRSRMIGEERLNFPQNHIESDNRLSWFLGRLDKKYGNDAFYVHLIRDKESTSRSYNQRWLGYVSIMRAYTHGILKTRISKLSDQEKLSICEDYYDTVNTNIEHFLKDKEGKMIIRLESIKTDFSVFWEKIGATGDLETALTEFDKRYNKSLKNTPATIWKKFTLWLKQ